MILVKKEKNLKMMTDDNIEVKPVKKVRRTRSQRFVKGALVLKDKQQLKALKEFAPNLLKDVSEYKKEEKKEDSETKEFMEIAERTEIPESKEDITESEEVVIMKENKLSIDFFGLENSESPSMESLRNGVVTDRGMNKSETNLMDISPVTDRPGMKMSRSSSFMMAQIPEEYKPKSMTGSPTPSEDIKSRKSWLKRNSNRPGSKKGSRASKKGSGSRPNSFVDGEKAKEIEKTFEIFMGGKSEILYFSFLSFFFL